MKGVYKWFPLIDAGGVCSWPGKFDTQEKIDELRQSVGNELAWRQEYLLEIISDHTRVVHPEWVQCYDEIPKQEHKDAAIVGVDLAISQKATADYTAMVTILTQSYGSKLRAYVLPNPINDHLTFPDVVQTAAAIKAKLKTSHCESPEFVVESNGFQEIYVQAFAQAGCKVEGVKQMSDKRSRIALTTDLIKNGIVKFPKTGCEDLLMQLTGFGSENHDDLADAFATAMIAVMEKINGSRSFEAWKELCGQMAAVCGSVGTSCGICSRLLMYELHRYPAGLRDKLTFKYADLTSAD
jgi:predicted phage terminase large subunit-like protein